MSSTTATNAGGKNKEQSLVFRQDLHQPNDDELTPIEKSMEQITYMVHSCVVFTCHVKSSGLTLAYAEEKP